MNHLFTAIIQSDVIIFASDLETLLNNFSKCEPTIRMQPAEYYKKQLVDNSTVIVMVDEEKDYILQKVF